MKEGRKLISEIKKNAGLESSGQVQVKYKQVGDKRNTDLSQDSINTALIQDTTTTTWCC